MLGFITSPTVASETGSLDRLEVGGLTYDLHLKIFFKKKYFQRLEILKVCLM